MSEDKAKGVDNTEEPNLIDRIANELPPDARADYYREMMYCKSLREDDEMLRILRVMQILTLIMVEIPGKIAGERKEYETIFMVVLHKLQENQRANQNYLDKLGAHLTGIPKKIAEDINPAAIVSKINESLKQEFLRSTIPQTGESLQLVSKQMKSASDEFASTAKELTHSYRGVTEKANQAIDRMSKSITGAAEAATEAAKNLSRTFHRHYRGALYTLTILAILVGIGIGMLLQHWRSQPPDTHEYMYRNDLFAPAPAPSTIPKKK